MLIFNKKTLESIVMSQFYARSFSAVSLVLCTMFVYMSA